MLAQSTEFVPSNLANNTSSNSSPNFRLGNSYASPVRSPQATLGGSPLSHAPSQSPPPKILHPTPVQPAAVSTYQVLSGSKPIFHVDTLLCYIFKTFYFVITSQASQQVIV